MGCSASAETLPSPDVANPLSQQGPRGQRYRRWLEAGATAGGESPRQRGGVQGGGSRERGGPQGGGVRDASVDPCSALLALRHILDGLIWDGLVCAGSTDPTCTIVFGVGLYQALVIAEAAAMTQVPGTS